MGRKPTLESAKKPTIQVTAAAKNRFVVWLESQRNPHQGETVAAILQWFTSQPLTVQHVILSQIPPEMQTAYADALIRIGRDLKEGRARITEAGEVRQQMAVKSQKRKPEGNGA